MHDLKYIYINITLPMVSDSLVSTHSRLGKPRNIINPDDRPTPTPRGREISGWPAGLKRKRAIHLLQHILVLSRDIGREPDVDVPLRIARRVIARIQREDDPSGVIAVVVAEFRRVAREKDVLAERRGRVDAEDDVAEALRSGNVGRPRGHGGRVGARAVVRGDAAVALRAVEARVGGWCRCAPWVWVLPRAPLRHGDEARVRPGQFARRGAFACRFVELFAEAAVGGNVFLLRSWCVN